MLTGSCLCGDITFTLTRLPRGASVCHCSQCRKMSGHVWASAYVPEDGLSIIGPVHWFRSSPDAKRGTCQNCGAFLFWQGTGEGTISFALGAIDGPTGLTLEKHIFTGSKGDYYTIDDALIQKD